MDADGGKRKHSFRQQPNKRAKVEDGSALKTGFGAKMLAKMGYKGEGGLGKEGAGISEPIQVVNRGTKGGIGSVAEKSEQQKREERRKAEENGERYVDTSEEEREERKKRKAKARGEARTATPRPKKTLYELEAAGMHVPPVLQSIIDATTGASTPASGVSLRGPDIVPFENSLQARDALEDMAAAFAELANIIQPRSRRIVSQAYTHPSEALVNQKTVEEEDTIKRGTTSAYESMMLKLWLPAVSSAVTQWDVKHPRPLLRLVEVWTPVLPPFVGKRVLEQVTRKLSTSIHEWNPRKFKKSPHTWVMEWLPFLGPADLDPKGSGLVAEIKRKIRHALHSIDLSKGPLPGMEQWRRLFGKGEFDHLLTSHLLPRLAAHLRDYFEIDPNEQQDVAPLKAVFAWKGLLSNEVIGELLRAHFFPRFLAILHQWVSSEGMVFEEVRAWLAWWRNDVQNELSNVSSVESGWKEAYTLVYQAKKLGEARLTDLPTPQMESTGPSVETVRPAQPVNKEPAPSAPPVRERTFKDTVERFCEEESLLLIPLREAHDQTALPLFRITASATGRGGAVVYLKDDSVWVQNKKDKSVWDPIELGEVLIAKAEGQ
ncbi:hypothetical protein COCC4DRAFT_132585 [Bipolaris maydis ATCC 48331]|uniref:G-patch domain-containing protein n=2 Tax=Cochliobolus heterostrophus TaxID=5016 RepID=M2U3U4_COCH5|nr:uncharacterized protein COCC4DRAFT_132585 [Bipolaris maydis ATCC 48331]EMD93224.1 hypothetical protein COCHEDRAFT_1170666 [Bipolaris maydis C5]ENI07329.1 hypothetical protein COCC4DRAFT_132585 [Bipolaris maydis ATCC 48331]KAJ6204490.1 GC-rich sequence DNA-binding factor-like protein-domain-containing protein [Bipolaris maydis]